MGMYVSARGWIQLAHHQRRAAEQVIQRHSDDFYSGGWAFPAKPFNWSLQVVYGGDIRESAERNVYLRVSNCVVGDPQENDSAVRGDDPLLCHETCLTARMAGTLPDWPDSMLDRREGCCPASDSSARGFAALSLPRRAAATQPLRPELPARRFGSVSYESAGGWECLVVAALKLPAPVRV